MSSNIKRSIYIVVRIDGAAEIGFDSQSPAKRYTHNIADHQFGYDDWLAAQCGCPATEEWRRQMYFAAIENMLTKPGTYRDEWEYHCLVFQAHEDFKKYALNGHIN